MRLILSFILLVLMITTQLSLAANLKSNTPSKNTENQASNAGFAENIHGFLQLGTDHVWRGISFTNHSPEFFGSMLYLSPGGIYGGLIAYDTILSESGIGLAPIVGIKGERNKLSYDISARYEDYPKYQTAVTPDIFEIYGELGYVFSKLLKLTGGIGYSPNYYFHSGTGVYINGMAFVTLPKEFTLYGGAGYQFTQKGGQPSNLWFKNYLNGIVGICKDFKHELRIGFQYTQTNLNKVECNGLNICSPAYNLYARKSF